MLLILIMIFIIGIFLFDYKNTLETYKNNQTYTPVLLNDPIKLARYKKFNPNPDIQSNLVSTADIQQIKKQLQMRSIYRPKTKENFKVKIDPIIKNPKYRLYGEDNLNFVKAGIIKQPTDIDQSTNINIMNHANNSINKTIKDIYDEITNDNRDINVNLENLNAYDPLDNYNIDKKYGSTQFDTYSIKN